MKTPRPPIVAIAILLASLLASLSTTPSRAIAQAPAGAPQTGKPAVAGQDSVQAVAHRAQIHWLRGDTNRLSYPLGLFRSAGATTPLPDPRDPAIDPTRGIPFTDFLGSPTAAEPEASCGR